ncbi:MAG: Gfo/Idh/MocA family oxidoreductase [Candidatus Krumholzibacteria bacterium]|nr:Gfo/Idh/MocA family oxidoreductase [Candidatus Krumholzibacteria bacterium]
MGLRVGVIGTGRLGREHVRVLKKVPEVEHVACYDIVSEKSRRVAEAFGAEPYSDVRKLMRDVDAVSVVVPTVRHTEVSLQALEHGNNLFLEKPIAASVSEAVRIIDTARKLRRVLQVGHIERFNAAIREALPHIKRPSFIEIHRLAPFTVRGIDVSVIMDLMIHDIDLLTWFLDAKPNDIRAKGAGILTNGPDIVNARLEYDGGCVANLTASRVSVEPMRKVRIFSETSYLSIDLLRGSIKHFRKGNKFDEHVHNLKNGHVDLVDISLHDVLAIDETKIEGEEPLFQELQSFCQTVSNGEAPAVSGEDGLTALQVATEIQDKSQLSNR